MMHSPYNPPGASGGRRQRTGNDDLCLICHRLRCICHLCRRPFLLAEVPGNRRVSGSGRLPKATETELRRDPGRYFPGFLCHRGYPGTPLAWGCGRCSRLWWWIQRRCHSPSNTYTLAFAACATDMLFLLGGRSSRRTSIIDVVQEPHTSKSIREVKHWYGWVGIM